MNYKVLEATKSSITRRIIEKCVGSVKKQFLSNDLPCLLLCFTCFFNTCKRKVAQKRLPRYCGNNVWRSWPPTCPKGRTHKTISPKSFSSNVEADACKISHQQLKKMLRNNPLGSQSPKFFQSKFFSASMNDPSYVSEHLKKIFKDLTKNFFTKKMIWLLCHF
jgi:hypothetical protein